MDKNEYISKLKKYFHPISSEVTIFDEDKISDEWFTQFNNGCILFSLVNGKFKSEKLLTDFHFQKNDNFKVRENGKINKKNLVKGVIHEYKSILIWYILTKNNVLGQKISECSQFVKKLLDSDTYDVAIEIARNLNVLYSNDENQFAMKSDENFNYANWSFDNLEVKVVDEKFLNIDNKFKNETMLLKKNFLSHLPRFSLICSSSQHWRVFLGVMNDVVIMYDSSIYDGLYSCDLDSYFEDVISVIIKKNEDK